MSAINPLANHSTVQKVTHQPIQKQIPPDSPAPGREVADKLELSGVSHLLKLLKSNDIRADKIQQIKSQIEAGTYEDEQKLEIAVDRLLDDLQK